MSRIPLSIFKCVFGCVLFAGLPLVGWGVTDIQGFAANTARLAFLVTVVVLQIALVVLFPGIGQGSGAGKETVRRQRLAVILLQVFSLALVVAGPYDDRRHIAALGDVEASRYLGLVTFSFGFVLMTWAQVSLGRQFSIQVTLQESHRLITGGLYRNLRNPRYLGIVLFNFGFSLVFLSGLALLLSAAITAVLLWRIHDEEALMQKEFGEEWAEYTKRSWRLLPYVW